MIWIKIFLVFLSCFLFRGIWSRLADYFVRKKVSEKPISKMLFFSALQQAFQASLDQALLLPWIQMRARESSKRVWLTKLGLSPLSGILLLAIIWFWIYFLGLRGTFIELNLVQTLSDPPSWVWWLGDQSISTLLVLLGFGIFSSVLLRRPFFGTAVAGVLIFSGLLSVAGGVCILVGERFGLKLLFRLKYRSEMLYREMDWSLVFGVLVMVACALWGRALVGLLSQVGFQNTFHPANRFELLTVTLLLWSVLEAFLSMAFYHFYWIKCQSNDN